MCLRAERILGVYGNRYWEVGAVHQQVPFRANWHVLNVALLRLREVRLARLQQHEEIDEKDWDQQLTHSTDLGTPRKQQVLVAQHAQLV